MEKTFGIQFMSFEQDVKNGKNDGEQVKNNRVLIAEGQSRDKSSVACNSEHYWEFYLKHYYDAGSLLSSSSNRTSL